MWPRLWVGIYWDAMWNRFDIQTSLLIMFKTLMHVNHGKQFIKLGNPVVIFNSYSEFTDGWIEWWLQRIILYRRIIVPCCNGYYSSRHNPRIHKVNVCCFSSKYADFCGYVNKYCCGVFFKLIQLSTCSKVWFTSLAHEPRTNWIFNILIYYKQNCF